MKAILFVALGGALGSLLRFGIGIWLKPEYHAAFPIHTLLINTVGCLIIGCVFALLQTNNEQLTLQYFLVTGILGGFTTFSSYTMETVYLYQQGEFLRASSYVLLSNVLGIGSAALGYSFFKHVF